MPRHISFKHIFITALVVFASACLPANLGQDLTQTMTLSGTGEDDRYEEGWMQQQCISEYLIEGRTEVNRNLRMTNDDFSSLRALSNLARCYFMLGELEQKNAKEQYYQMGCYFADELRREYPLQVEGYYWLALNLCGLCEVRGPGSALVELPKIVEHLEAAVSLDQTYDQAGPLRALGRIRSKAPAWPLSEGNPIEAVRDLRTAAEIAPYNSTNHLYLAEALLDQGYKEEGCRELERIFGATQNATSPCSVEEDRADALRLKEKCN